MIGVVANDQETNERYELRGKVFINATGFFSDCIRTLDEKNSEPTTIASQGTHIVLDKSFLSGNCSIILPETSNRSVLFAIPWYNRVLVGTTDTPIKTLSLEPIPKKSEIEYLINRIGKYLIKKPKVSDILSKFTGIRALARPPAATSSLSAISRDYLINVSQSKLISITGGKWTLYRKIGQDVVDMGIKIHNLPQKQCRTSDLPIHGCSLPTTSSEWSYYGTDELLIEKLSFSNKLWFEKFDPSLPCRPIDVIWGARYEMARTVEDILARRTRCLLLNAQVSIDIAPQVAKIMAKEMNKNNQWEETQINQFLKIARNYT